MSSDVLVPHRPERAGFVDRDTCIGCEGSSLEIIASGKFTDEPLRIFLTADPWGQDPLPFLEGAEWRLVRCRECSQVFHRRILDERWSERCFSAWMTAEAILRFEENLHHSVQDLFDFGRGKVGHVLRLERLTRTLRSDRDKVRLLDFGCGWGEFLSICRCFGFDAVGIDRSQARRTAQATIHASVEELPTKATFHAITMFEVLEHLDAPLAVLRTLTARLVTGGVLVLETPDCTGVTGIRTLSDYRKVHPLSHINAYTRDSLITTCKRLGLRHVARGPVHVTTSMPRVLRTAAKHLLGRDGRSTQLYFRKT